MITDWVSKLQIICDWPTWPTIEMLIASKNGRSLTCKVFRYHHHLCDFVSVPLWEVWCWEPAAACQQTARGSCSRLWERWSHRRHFHSPRICDGSVQRRNIEFCRYIYMYIMINHSHTIVQLSSDTTVSMMLPIGYRLLLYTQQVSLKVDMFKAAKVQGRVSWCLTLPGSRSRPRPSGRRGWRRRRWPCGSPSPPRCPPHRRGPGTSPWLQQGYRLAKIWG